MILPTKHISIDNSLINVGAIILRKLEAPKTVTSLWDICREKQEITTFERFSLVLDFLFTIGIIDYSEGLLKRCHE